MESARRPPRTTRPTKILRIGILLGGRLVEERLVRDQGRITIGQSARSTFVVPDEALGREVTLFQPTPAGYELVISQGMDARLGGGAGRVPDGATCLPLPDDARGKVTCGDVTVLFQLVAPPPPRPAPRLPASVRGSFGSQIDRTTAGILSGSLAVHVAFFAYLGFFVEIPRDVEAKEVWIPPVRSIRVDVKRPEMKQAGTGEGKASTAAQPPRSAKRGPSIARRPLTDDEARRLAATVGIMNKPITSNGPGGRGFFADALKGGHAQDNLDAAIHRLGGVRSPNPVEVSGLAGRDGHHGGGRIREISELARDVGPVRQGGDPTGQIRAHRPTIKPPTVREEDTDLTDVAGVNRTLRNGYGAMKACYDRGLKHDQTLRGKLAVRITVSGAGMVTAVKAREATIPDRDVVECMTASIRSWRFPPAGSGKVAAVEATWLFKAGD